MAARVARRRMGARRSLDAEDEAKGMSDLVRLMGNPGGTVRSRTAG
jgi:hypothetical protein